MKKPLLLIVGLAMSASLVHAQGRESSENDAFEVELMAISDLLAGPDARGRLIVLDPRFAETGHAPPSVSLGRRPTLRQRSLHSAIRLMGDSTGDTLLVRASQPQFGRLGATVCVTISHRGIPGRRRGAFYQTVEYVLRRDAGRWVIQRRNELGIT